jgi:outer membrane protein assembly factor BamB
MKQRKAILTIPVILLFSFSSLTLSYAQSPSIVNWNSNGNYGLNWDYADQTQINSSTASGLSLKWVVPLPPAAPPYTLNGIATTPLIENGIAYFITQDGAVDALNTANGAIIWQFYAPIPLDNESASISGNPGAYHAHNSDIFFSSNILGQPLVWFIFEGGIGYYVFALSADTGTLVVNYSVPFQNLPGVRGTYAFTGRDAILDQQNGVLIIGTGSISEGVGMPRGFFIGINVKVNPPQVIWETPVMPPQDGSDPNWDIQSIQNMKGAWIFNGTGAVDLKKLSPSVLNSTFYDDWGLARYYNGTNSFAGTGSGWGGAWAVDSSSGVAFVATDQPGPDFNATFRPGPNLWSDSVLAINETTGQFIWAFQTTAHDLWDYDCAWSVLFVNATLSNGQIQPEVLKGCKNGYFYALDPNTGALLWYFNPPDILRLNSEEFDPLNSTQMTQPWMFSPSGASSGWFNPCATGGFESDPAYNPQTGYVYMVSYNSQCSITIIPVPPTPNSPSPVPPFSAYDTDFGATTFGTNNIYNATIWAVDAATGKPVWHVFIPNQGFRGGITTTADILAVPLINGTIDVLDARTGSIVAQPFTGAGMDTQPAIGTDPNSNVILLQPLGAADAFTIGGLTPGLTGGTIVALSLKIAAPPTVTSGISPTAFYAVASLAAVLAVVSVVLGLTRRRTSHPSS